MNKKFSIHDWQAKIRLAEQDDYQKRQDRLTPGKNPDAFYGPGSFYQKMKQKNAKPGMSIDNDEWEKEMGRDPKFGGLPMASKDNKSQETMDNADIKALQTVVGKNSLNKILNTISVIADRLGKNDEADIIKKLANQIQDFEPMDIDEANMTGTGVSFNAGDSMGHYGKRKKKIHEDEEEAPEVEKSRDSKIVGKILSDKINTKDEWIEIFELLMDHSEEISQITPAVIRTLLQKSLKEI